MNIMYMYNIKHIHAVDYMYMYMHVYVYTQRKCTRIYIDPPLALPQVLTVDA